MTPEQRLEHLGIMLPTPPVPVATYVPWRFAGPLLFLSGQGPSRIEAVAKLLGMVNAEPDFADHPKVINGCSDLFVDILGDAGKHARSAVGMGSLPYRMTVEIEAILLVRT
jgi:enamine deaminase RidA (YjgF/YER057c/UK114 family)